MKRFATIIILILIYSCSQRDIPSVLKSNLDQFEVSVNDTVKYDFKIAPENVAVTKMAIQHEPFQYGEKYISKNPSLESWFKKRGIKYTSDMNEILWRALHKKLNNKSINFKELKNVIKERYRIIRIKNDSIRIRKINEEHLYYRKIEKPYLSKFIEKQTVLGYLTPGFIYINNENGYGYSTSYVKYIAKIIQRNDYELKVELLKLAQTENGVLKNLTEGDTITTHTGDVFLIP
ncbi:hypothetical protein [Winogradskyella tangerina]|uniref:hypothetical protein n=1 Tax=Winogradskyella tangerina TaxID=2023240 RepID=UPI000DBE267A|nr:hypothetical protein [Winogradskyella tangerina]